MKTCKQDVCLCERDTLRDMLREENNLLNLYHAALLAGSSKSLRKALLKNYSLLLETQFSVMEQMNARGYFTWTSAGEATEKEKERFSKTLRQMKK